MKETTRTHTNDRRRAAAPALLATLALAAGAAAPARAAGDDPGQEKTVVVQQERERERMRAAQKDLLRTQIEMKTDMPMKIDMRMKELSSMRMTMDMRMKELDDLRMTMVDHDQDGKDNDPGRQALQQGRDLMDDDHWEEAAERFRDVIAKYPQLKQLDAAYYFLAYSLKKLGNYEDAYRTVDKMLADYSKSRWAGDAKVLQIELARLLGKPIPPGDPGGPQPDDELKIAALQSLFESNPERAIGIAGDVLKPGSKSSTRLQQAAAILLGQQGGERSLDILLTTATTSTDEKVQKAALVGVSQMLDEKKPNDRAFNSLKEIITTTANAEIAKTALFAIVHENSPRVRQLLVDLASSSKFPEVRRNAVYQLGQQHDDGAFDALVKIYDGAKAAGDLPTRRNVVTALAQSENARALDKLMEIARNDPDTDVRRISVILLAQRDQGRAIDALIQWYDTEKNETVKESIVDGLGQACESGSKPALRKLIQIAKNDPLLPIRKKAIHWIGQSKDPEAMQFLEEILK